MFEHTNQNAEALVIRNRDDFTKEVSFTPTLTRTRNTLTRIRNTLTRIRSRQSLFGRILMTKFLDCKMHNLNVSQN